MKRLTSFDASFLANERDGSHMAIGAVMLCRGSAPSQAELREHVRTRLHLLPSFRRRLATPPLGLGRPFWVDDPDFELDRHLKRFSLAAPGSEQQFRELVDRVLAEPLERSRPLWQLCLIEGLEGGRFGLIYRVHHALADGFSAVDIAALLFDFKPSPARAAAEGESFPAGDQRDPWQPQPSPSQGRLAMEAVRGLGGALRVSGRWLAGAVRKPSRAGAAVAEGAAGLREVAVAMARRAPRSPLNEEIGPGRRYAWVSIDLAEMRRIKEGMGGTVNDVALAVCTGALRGWLIETGFPIAPDMELKALVPVSLRAEEERGTLGNRLTALRGPLPVGIDDPVGRMRRISDEMRRLKGSRQALGAQTIWRINDWFRDFAPPLILAPTAAINFSTRIFNVLITNFPGPQTPLHLLGREMVGVYPVGFLARRHRLAIAIISYNGALNIGLLSDAEAGPDPDRLAERLEAAVAELSAAVPEDPGSPTPNR